MAKSIKIDTDLWKRIEAHAAAAGYSSPEEFVLHALERELALQEGADSESRQEAERTLRGLGYLE